MEINVELVDADRLITRLGKASENLDPETVEGLNEVADRIVDDAKAIVAVDTGSLQRSIRRQRHVSDGHLHSVSVSAGGYVVNPETGRTVDYAVYVEYGTSRTTPQPFMQPALEMNRFHLLQVLRGKMGESLR